MEDNDIVKTTITFNPKLPEEAIVLQHLYEKGKFSTNIKNQLIKSFCGKQEKQMFINMSEEELIGNLGLLLYCIDKKGLDISKMVMGYCNINAALLKTEQEEEVESYNIVQDNEQDDIEQDIEDVENCGIDLCWLKTK